MTLKLPFVVVALTLLEMTLPASGEGALKEPAQKTTTESLDFAPGGTIRIYGSHGDVNVEGWDRPEVEITLIKSTKRLYTTTDTEAAKKRLDMIVVKLDRKSADIDDARFIEQERNSRRSYPPFEFGRVLDQIVIAFNNGQTEARFQRSS